MCEGEDLVGAATAQPVELLVAGENVDVKLIAEVSSAAHPPRVVAVFRREDLPGPEPRAATLSLHGVSDPGNVGTLIRTADAFGAGVELHGGADPTSPKALRASAGSIWRVPLHAGEGRTVALVAHGGQALHEADLYGPTVFLLGSERGGLPDDVEADLRVTIPVTTESLNVATAGAIALYEWRRQNP